jgi:cytochrome c oxidase assembly factor CtaG
MAAWADAADGHRDWTELLSTWTWDPLVVVLLAATTAAYAIGVRRPRGIRRWELVSFAAGQATLVIALLSPIDALSDVLFAAHMGQHEMLMLVSAPLLVLGRPLIAFLWALPPRARAVVGGWTLAPAFKRTWRTISHPVVVVAVHGVAVWIWHLEPLFEAAMHSEAVHAVQHAIFFFTAALFWWALAHGRYGRMGYGMAVVYVFATALHTGLLGAMATLTKSAWYPTYVERAPAWGVGALEDQQLAGLIMWIPAGVLFVVLGLAFFAAWLGEAERRVGYTRAEARTAHAAEHALAEERRAG